MLHGQIRQDVIKNLKKENINYQRHLTESETKIVTIQKIDDQIYLGIITRKLNNFDIEFGNFSIRLTKDEAEKLLSNWESIWYATKCCEDLREPEQFQRLFPVKRKGEEKKQLLLPM